MTEVSEGSPFMPLPQGLNNGDRQEWKEHQARENSCNYFVAGHHCHFAFGSGRRTNACGWAGILRAWAAACLAPRSLSTAHHGKEMA